MVTIPTEEQGETGHIARPQHSSPLPLRVLIAVQGGIDVDARGGRHVTRTPSVLASGRVDHDAYLVLDIF